ncbi:hypothetical protein GCM10022269_10340 [Sphingorhabdus rigui]
MNSGAALSLPSRKREGLGVGLQRLDQIDRLRLPPSPNPSRLPEGNIMETFSCPAITTSPNFAV